MLADELCRMCAGGVDPHQPALARPSPYVLEPRRSMSACRPSTSGHVALNGLLDTDGACGSGTEVMRR